MVRNVPFDPAGDPSAKKRDQRGLDDVLPIDKVISISLVNRLEYLAAKFRNDANADVFVFEIDYLVSSVGFLCRKVIV